jgi:hypothetical protein
VRSVNEFIYVLYGSALLATSWIPVPRTGIQTTCPGRVITLRGKIKIKTKSSHFIFYEFASELLGFASRLPANLRGLILITELYII